MSGVTFVINFDGAPAAQEVIQKMTQQVRHRGPHGVQYYCRDNLGFAFLQLISTPEAVHERQPLVDTRRNLTVLADARLDNRAELLNLLKDLLPSKTPITDLDLIFTAYLKWGKDCASHMLGDFAFIVWDGNARSVYAARDQIGLRTLYYARYRSSQTLCIASEAQQILQHPSALIKLDPIALLDWATARMGARHCMFSGVDAVPPGHYLFATQGEAKVVRYWDIDPSVSIRYKRIRDYEEHLIAVLTDAVADRLRTRTGAVGTELSGGMDSTTITALATKLLAGKNFSLHPVSYRFKDSPSCDETVFIEKFINHLGITTSYLDAEEAGLSGYPKDFPHSLESPWARQHPLLDHEFQLLADKGVDVVLTGNGGDELTSGGTRVLSYRLSQVDLCAIKDVYQWCKKYERPFFRIAYLTFVRPLVPEWARRAELWVRGKQSASRPHWVRDIPARQHQIERDREVYARTKMQNGALDDVYANFFFGTTSAAYVGYEYTASRFGIEARHPFMDRRVVEYCFSIPISLWYKDIFPKWLLRRATEALLPDEVRWRPDKSSSLEAFSKAIKRNSAYVEEVLGYPYLQDSGLCDVGVLRQEFVEHFRRGGQWNRADLDFALSLQCWLFTNRFAFNSCNGGGR